MLSGSDLGCSSWSGPVWNVPKGQGVDKDVTIPGPLDYRQLAKVMPLAHVAHLSHLLLPSTHLGHVDIPWTREGRHAWKGFLQDAAWMEGMRGLQDRCMACSGIAELVGNWCRKLSYLKTLKNINQNYTCCCWDCSTQPDRHMEVACEFVLVASSFFRIWVHLYGSSGLV